MRTVRAASTTDDRQPSTFSSTTGVSLSELCPCTEDEFLKLISQSPTKSCALDPFPTFLLKELIDVLLPHLTAMVNASLRAGRLPSTQKHAVVAPLLKKSGLDVEEPKNYRPVTNNDVCIQTSGEGRCITTRHLLECQRINASTAVGVPTSPQH